MRIQRPLAAFLLIALAMTLALPVHAAPAPVPFQVFLPIARGPACNPTGSTAPRSSGPGQTICFNAHEPVVGFEIVLTAPAPNVYHQCYLANPPVDGTVTDGVVHPEAGDIGALPACANPTGRRRETGPGVTKPFAAHEPVIGDDIVLPDVTYHACYLSDPPNSGSVTTGVVWPSQQEIDAATECSKRQETGPAGTLDFSAGVTVIGSVITDTVTMSVDTNCVWENAKDSGKVFDGVIWPTPAEIAAAPRHCNL